jgi:hypothetical protein
MQEMGSQCHLLTSDGLDYTGRCYQADVPDTLDLAERAALAINGIGGSIDPELQQQMFFLVQYARNPPLMQHHAADTTCDPKFAESLTMMRLMCGSDQYLEAEAAQRQELLGRVEDGLYWNRVDVARPWRTSYNAAFDGQRQEEDLANVVGVARLLRALLAWRELSADARWDARIHALVRGLRRIAVDRGELSYYPDGGFGEPFNYPRSGWRHTSEPAGETEGGEGSVVCYQGHQIQALARWYVASGDALALDLAARLTRFCMLLRFWGGLPDPERRDPRLVGHVAARLPDPACVAGAEQGHWYSHFHARAIALRGMLEYARAAGDQRVLEFVRRAYEHTWTMGISRMGWVNTYPVAINLCEGCALGDLVALGIRLSDAGAGDYWDDVDAVLRNQLVEQQLTRADILQRIAAASPPPTVEELGPYPRRNLSGPEVIARTLGAFAGHSAPTSIPRPWVMQCCTGNASQGLYYGWEGIVRQEGDGAQVNLLLNRAAPGLDVESDLPYEGRVVLRIKSLRRVAVRIPAWVDRRALRATVGDAARPQAWAGSYLLLDDLRPGQSVTLTFPVGESAASYTVNSGTPMEQTYRCVWRGSTLVDISPRDEAPTSYPLYQRAGWRAAVAPRRIARRFVAGGELRRW